MKVALLLFYLQLNCILISAKLSFFILGDWGGKDAFPYTTDIQLRVANSMGNLASTIKPSFVVSTGDNFYDYGVPHADSSRFIDSFENVYSHSDLQCEWYISAGNRDHYGNITALIDYTHKSQRWNFTSLNWDYVFPIPNTDASLHLIQVNSWDLTGQSRSDNVGAAPPDPVIMVETVNWISKTLSSSTATWRVILTHYPIWAAGAHGPNDLYLVNLLEPILLQHEVDFYLAGHDHALEHVFVNGLNYYIVGAGSEVAETWTGESGLPPNSLKFSYPAPNVNIGGFAVATLDATTFQIDYYNDQGQLLYTANQNAKTRTVKPPTPPVSYPVPPPPTNTNNNTAISQDPALLVSPGLSDSTLFGLVLGIVGSLLLIAAIVLVVLMMKERNKKIDKLKKKDQKN